MRTIWDYIIMLIGTLGSFASIVALGVFFNKLTTEGWIAVLFMGLICVYFVVYNFWLLKWELKEFLCPRGAAARHQQEQSLSEAITPKEK